MYYGKQISPSKLKRASYTINDFSNGSDFSHDKRVVPFYKAVTSYNFECESGVLKDAKGIRACSFGDGLKKLKINMPTPQKLYYFKPFNEQSNEYYDVLLVYANGKIYSANPYIDEEFSLVPDLKFSSPPIAVRYNYNGENVIIFSADGIMKIYDGKNVQTVTDAPCITSMCIHSERLFATEGGEKRRLWFSDDFDPSNWNVSLQDAGFIDFKDERGSLLKVFSFGGYVYLFRNYGINRITAYGDQTAYEVEGICSSSGKIFGDSITVCGDRIIYLAEDGFYLFSGSTPTRILSGLDECLKGVDNTSALGAYYNGKFYCLLNLKIEDVVQKCLIYYDLHKKSFTVCKNLSVEDFQIMDGELDFKLLFLSADNEVLGELSDKSEYYGLPLLKKWESAKYDFLKSFEKVVTSVTLITQTAITLTVKSESECRRIRFSASNKPQTKKLGIKGNAFTFFIECDLPSSNISRFKIDYEYFTE